MIIHEGYENLDIITPVVTLGVFDGVHKGHMSLLSHLVSKAREANGEAVVITFSPHPRLVLEPDRTDLAFLTTMDEKKVLLEKANINHLVIIEFNKEFSNIPACDFVRDVLVKKVGTKHLIIGYNHHFGRRGEGNFNTIKSCTETLDFRIEQVHGFQEGEALVSSSSVRKALMDGNLKEATTGLGYYYSITGTIIEGRKIGRSLGFPTANIKPDYEHKLIPANGVYASEVLVDNQFLPGMLSIGSNPTVNDNATTRSIEVHILDFERDIYGKKITIFFRKRLRDEIKFENTMQLSEQMKIDRQQTLRLLT